MAKNIKRYFGIKFPFTIKNENGWYIDLNSTADEKIATEILHVLLTPKRTRIRKPDFGTDLIKYIFEPSDDEAWTMVKNEAISSVSKYVSNVDLKDIQIYRNDDNGLYLYLRYTVNLGQYKEDKELGIKL